MLQHVMVRGGDLPATASQLVQHARRGRREAPHGRRRLGLQHWQGALVCVQRSGLLPSCVAWRRRCSLLLETNALCTSFGPHAFFAAARPPPLCSQAAPSARPASQATAREGTPGLVSSAAVLMLGSAPGPNLTIPRETNKQTHTLELIGSLLHRSVATDLSTAHFQSVLLTSNTARRPPRRRPGCEWMCLPSGSSLCRMTLQLLLLLLTAAPMVCGWSNGQSLTPCATRPYLPLLMCPACLGALPAAATSACPLPTTIATRA